MKKFLEFDWLRAVQFQGNIVQKKSNTVICTKLPFFGTVWLFKCILLIGVSMVSSAIWKNTHLWVFQRPQITLILRPHAILIVFEKLAFACFFQIVLETMLLPIIMLLDCSNSNMADWSVEGDHVVGIQAHVTVCWIELAPHNKIF